MRQENCARLRIARRRTATAPNAAEDAPATESSAKGVSCSSKGPGVSALANALSSSCFGAQQAAVLGSGDTDTKLGDVLGDPDIPSGKLALRDVLGCLDISPGKPADKTRRDMRRGWTTVDNWEDTVQVIQMDERDLVMGIVAESVVQEGDNSDDGGDGGDESLGMGGTAVPPSYAHRLSQSGSFESLEKASKSNSAAYHPQKAKMSVLKPTRFQTSVGGRHRGVQERIMEFVSKL